MIQRIKDWLINRLGGFTRKCWTDTWLSEDLRHDKALLEKDKVIKEILSLSENTPGDCKRGAWCSECIFAKKKVVRVGATPYYEHYTTYYCGKDETCKHLTVKGD